MAIWVDADSCPAVIREILYRAAERAQLSMTFVANKPMRLPVSRWLRSVQVGSGFDAAGDLFVTGDVPPSALGIERGALALSPRGERFTPENVRERLSIRNFTETLRGGGLVGGGPGALDARDKTRFANALDGWIARRPKRGDAAATPAVQ
jgi:uncharacterized protein